MIVELIAKTAKGPDLTTTFLTIAGTLLVGIIGALVAWILRAQQAQRRWLLELKWQHYTQALMNFDMGAQIRSKKSVSEVDRKIMLEGIDSAKAHMALLAPFPLYVGQSGDVVRVLGAEDFDWDLFNDKRTSLVLAMRRDLGIKRGTSRRAKADSLRAKE